MGKGDKKSRKGKIAIGSYGNTRKRKANKATVSGAVAKGADEAKPKKTARKKSEA